MLYWKGVEDYEYPCKVISFIKFIKQEEESILVLETEDEEEIAQLLKNNEWYSDNEINKI